MDDRRTAASVGATPAATPANRRPYVLGYLLSVALSLVPFLLVMTSALPRAALIAVVAIFAAAQVAVHLVFFLHLGRRGEPAWNVHVLLYTAVILAILVGASVWIMYHLDANMMGP